MKDFFKYVGATVTGLLVFSIIVILFGVMSIVGIVASSEATRNVEANSVLVVNLDGTLQEQATDDLKTQLTGSSVLGLSEMLAAIKNAQANDDIRGIFLNAGMLDADMAQLEELREALTGFKKTGKWIVAYGEDYSQACYYLASVANKVYMNPQGSIDWHGIGGHAMFLRDVYAKIGVKVVPFKCGKYKSGTEIYTEDRMSGPSREQTERYIGGWWQTMCQAVSKSRGISTDTLNAYADRVVSLEDPQNMVKYKLVDGLLYADQVKQTIKKMLSLKEDEPINQISVDDMGKAPVQSEGDEIAVYYAYGTIVNEATPRGLLEGDHQIVAQDVCKDLEELADNDDIKAVVLRINSGGGSAYASEQLWHQIQLLKAKKPVVVSMGGAAASGGYYMSAAASYIFAEPTTITGSIGIYGLSLDRSELMTQKLGFRYDEIKTNRNSTMGAEVVPMTSEQMGYTQAAINRGYTLFKSRVAQGRHMTMDKVESHAQGHVFLGSDAVKLGLVDELGGLDKAVAKAAKLARINQYYTTDYPAPLGLMDQLLDSTDEGATGVLDAELRTVLGDFYEPFVLMRTARYHQGLQARMPFIIKLK